MAALVQYGIRIMYYTCTVRTVEALYSRGARAVNCQYGTDRALGIVSSGLIKVMVGGTVGGTIDNR
jgi:hypothetical protein